MADPSQVGTHPWCPTSATHPRITTQATEGGERAILQIEPRKSKFETLDDLGMRPKMQEQLPEVLRQNGFFLFSTLPGDGLTTTIDTVLKAPGGDV